MRQRRGALRGRRHPARQHRPGTAPPPISTSGRLTFLGWRRRVRPRARPETEARPLPGRDRTGLPAPLILHLAAAAAILERGTSLSPLAGTDRFPWAPGFAAGLSCAVPPPPAAVALEAIARLRRMVEGIERWQAHPHRRRLADPPALWDAGAARLLDFGGSGPTVLAVPSLVNRATILDLGPGTSLMRHLAARGLRVLLLDWGAPGPAEAGFDLTAYLDLRLGPALAAASEIGGPVGLLGYCMGGTLAVAAALAAPARVARLALVGAPWRFAGGSGTPAFLRGLAREAGEARLASALAALDRAFGAVPADLLQALFAMLDPGLALAKFRRFAALDPASSVARTFVELEDWLQDPVPLAGPAAVEILVDWHLRDLTGRGLWVASGRRVRPEELRCPALLFCSPRDRIAPLAATLPLAEAIPGAGVIRPATGHVGMIVGSRAPGEVWAPLGDFLAGEQRAFQNATA